MLLQDRLQFVGFGGLLALLQALHGFNNHFGVFQEPFASQRLTVRHRSRSHIDEPRRDQECGSGKCHSDRGKCDRDEYR